MKVELSADDRAVFAAILDDLKRGKKIAGFPFLTTAAGLGIELDNTLADITDHPAVTVWILAVMGAVVTQLAHAHAESGGRDGRMIIKHAQQLVANNVVFATTADPVSTATILKVKRSAPS